MLVSRVICQTNWNTRFFVVFQSIISHGWQATGSQSPLLILLQCRQGNMGNRSYPGTVLGDVVGAAAWGSKIYTMRGGVGWLRADVYVACSVCVGGLS